MKIPDDLNYTDTHEWIRRTPEGVVVGVSDYAQGELTDVVFVELPQVGRHLAPREEMCALESVKAVAYIYAPIAGAIAAVNERLKKEPELINQDPYGDGWIVRITPDEPAQSVDLMDPPAYREKLEATGGSA